MKLSRQTREIINIVIFLAVAALLVVTYIVYPLNRTKAIMGRGDIDNYNEDSLPANDPSVWIDSGLAADSFMVEADGLTTLACLYILPDSSRHDSINGTVFLLHGDGEDRDAMIPLARMITEAGYSVVVYDQRATGRSTGKYRGDGQYESGDLEEVIRYLDLRNKIYHPLTVVGFDVGGEAALLNAKEDSRIDKVLAINPYLSSERMIGILKERYDCYWFPFYNTMMWWWYGIRSGYAAPYRGPETVEAVSSRTLLLVDETAVDDAEIVSLKELSSPEMLTVETLPADSTVLAKRILTFVTQE